MYPAPRATASRMDWPVRTVRWALLVIALASAALVYLGDARAPIARVVESNVRDFLMRAAADDRPDARMAIVDIDEDSIKTVGPWPWPRQTLAELAERILSDEGASLVVFDLVLTEPASTPEGKLGDARLAALASEGVLVAAQAFDYEQRQEAVAVGVTGGAVDFASGAPTATATGFVANFPELARGRCVGNIGFVPDYDGRVRRIAPLTVWHGARYPALTLAALRCTSDLDAIERLLAGLPIDDAGLWAFRFRRAPDRFHAVSASQVLGGLGAGTANRVEGNLSRPLAGRIVLVGSSALGLSDRVATPLAASAAGVTVHAEALAELLDVVYGNRPVAPPRWLMPMLLAATVPALWWIVGAGAGRLRHIVIALVVILPAWAAIAGWMTLTGQVRGVSGPLWGYAGVLLLQLPLEWSWTSERLRRRTRLLSRYVAPSVLAQLLAAKGEDPLTPRRATITVLIADMQDYTGLTSRSSLDEAASLTKRFLEQLTGPVLEMQGTLDRYTGDGLVAFWGAPIPEENHADRAMDAADAIVRNIERFNADRQREGNAPVSVRIGLASGSALTGDLGTRFRIAYTAVGDCINLASRLQQASRELEVRVLVSASVTQFCRRWKFRSLGTLPVRGLPNQQVFTPIEQGRSMDSRPDDARHRASR